MKTKNYFKDKTSPVRNFGGHFYKLSLLIVFALLTITACKKDRIDQPELQPAGPKPVWGPTIKPEMQVVIEKLLSYQNPPIPSVSPAQARALPNIFTAYNEVMQENNVAKPYTDVDTTRMSIPVTNGNISALIYTPKGNGPFPVIVYYHGGGWVLGNPQAYDASIRALSKLTGSVVVAVDYRKAPEFKFPTAHNDSFDAYKWVLGNTTTFKGDLNKVAVAGESAGGNLAASVSILARDNGIKLPVHQLLVYPIADYNTSSASYLQYAAAVPLNKPLMEWFFMNYLTNPLDGASPLIALVNANLSGLPPTTIISAEIDPLLSEGLLLADKLKAAGVAVNQKTFTGVTHEFFGMASLIPDAEAAQKLASDDLKKAFNK